MVKIDRVGESQSFKSWSAKIPSSYTKDSGLGRERADTCQKLGVGQLQTFFIGYNNVSIVPDLNLGSSFIYTYI